MYFTILKSVYLRQGPSNSLAQEFNCTYSGSPIPPPIPTTTTTTSSTSYSKNGGNNNGNRNKNVSMKRRAWAPSYPLPPNSQFSVTPRTSTFRFLNRWHFENVINKFKSGIAMLRWNKALWLAVRSPMAIIDHFFIKSALSDSHFKQSDWLR